MNELRDIIEREIMAIRKSVTEKPQMLSEYGKAYWDGNIEGLKWVLTKIGELRASAPIAETEVEGDGAYLSEQVLP